MGLSIAAQELVAEIASLLASQQQPGWDQLAMTYASAGALSRSTFHVVAGQERKSQRVPRQALEPFAELKEAMYEEGTGTWLSATIHVASDGSADVRYNYDEEPEWPYEVEPGVYREELERYPRSSENIPDWMKADAGL